MARINPGVARLLAAMKKLSEEVNDHEICRRLEILMSSEKEDIPPALMKRIFDTPDEIEPRDIQEPYTQYVMHYLYMLKRQKRNKDRVQTPVAKKKGSRRSGETL